MASVNKFVIYVRSVKASAYVTLTHNQSTSSHFSEHTSSVDTTTPRGVGKNAKILDKAVMTL